MLTNSFTCGAFAKQFSQQLDTPVRSTNAQGYLLKGEFAFASDS